MTEPSAYPGYGLGLPASGPGSVAPLSRRFIAIAIDWGLCQLAVWLLMGGQFGTGAAASFAPLAIFALENVLMVSVLGYTVGHRIMGMAVVRLTPDDPSLPSAWLAHTPGLRSGLVRAALLCLALPALFSDGEGRGYHDRAAGTVILRRPQSR